MSKRNATTSVETRLIQFVRRRSWNEHTRFNKADAVSALLCTKEEIDALWERLIDAGYIGTTLERGWYKAGT